MIGDLAVLGLDVIVGTVVADLKYLTGRHIGLPFSLARVSLAKVPVGILWR